MLSSSDAKWRCMWHMFVWSLLMTLVSQFLDIRDHYAFFFFAAASVLIMPVLTAVYSNTSGRHCAGLLRAGYVFCDPVLVCITITPVQLLSRLPKYLDEYFCLTLHDDWNKTLDCLQNKTWTSELLNLRHVDSHLYEGLVSDKNEKILVIQGCLVAPILLSLLMGRRTRKMALHTYIFSSAYWLIAAIEASDLLETALISKVYKHTIFTTEAIVSIVMIVTNAYAIVTLCSFLTPSPINGDKRLDRKFDLVYRWFAAVAGIFFVELPMLVARFQIIGTDTGRVIHGSFYMWIAKDIIFVFLIIIIIVRQRFLKNYMKHFKGTPCHAPFDNPSVTFEPEKRDVYIHQKKVRFLSPPVSGAKQTIGDKSQPKASILRKKSGNGNGVPVLMITDENSNGLPVIATEHNNVSLSDENGLPLTSGTVPSVIFTPTTETVSKMTDGQMALALVPSASECGPVPLTNIPQVGGTPSSYYTTASTDQKDVRVTFTTSSPTNEDAPDFPVPETKKSQTPSPSLSKQGSAEVSPISKSGGSPPNSSLLKKADPCNDPPAKKRKTLPKKVSFRSGALTPDAIAKALESSDSSSSDEEGL